MPPRRTLRVEEVADAAFHIVAAEGIAGLTLRPLAARLKTTVAVLSYQFGQKDVLVEQLIRHAADHEARHLNGLRTQLEDSTDLPVSLLGQIYEAILDDFITVLRPGTILLSDLLFNISGAAPSLALVDWLATRKTFWELLANRLTPKPAFDLATVLHGFAIDESAYGLALGTHDGYRWLRRLCIGRLASGICPQGERPADQRLFDHHTIALRAHAEWRFADILPTEGPQSVIVQAAADLIATRGVASVTHRAAAERTGLAASTVAYHFPSQPELVRAGLDRLIPSQQARLERDGSARYNVNDPMAPQRGIRPYQSFEIARAGFGIALSAARDSEWRNAAASLRTLRGHYLKQHLTETAAPVPFDALASQALIMAACGIANIEAWRGPEEASRLALPVIFTTLHDLGCAATGRNGLIPT